MIIFMIIAMVGLVATTGPGDYVSTKDSPRTMKMGPNKK